MTQVERIIQGLMILQNIDPDVQIVQTGEGIGAELSTTLTDSVTITRLEYIGWENVDCWWTFEIGG